MANICTDDHHSLTASPVRTLRCWIDTLNHGLMNAVETLWLWHDRARQRRQLSVLTAAQLHDIGISRTQAGYEADKPFWRG